MIWWKYRQEIKSAKVKNLNLKLEYSSETKISITWVYDILLVCSTNPELLCLVIQNINIVTYSVFIIKYVYWYMALQHAITAELLYMFK